MAVASGKRMMQTRPDLLSHELTELAGRVHRLQASVAEFQERSARTAAKNELIIARLNLHLTELGARVGESQAAIRGIYESRTWKALASVGGLLLRASGHAEGARQPDLLPAVPTPASPGTPAWTTPPLPQHPLLACDHPGTSARIPVRGTVEVRGWAIHPQGIREVQVQIDRQSPILAEYGTPRPDVARVYPAYPGADRSGFRFLWNTEEVPEGSHSLALKAIALDGTIEECRCEVWVDPLGTHAYHQWILLHEPDSAEVRRMAEQASAFACRPAISIAARVDHTPLPLLRKCLDSLIAQLYPNWELYLADDGSAGSDVTELLRQYVSRDARIRLNVPLAQSHGEYFALLDPSDALPVWALYEVVRAIHEFPGIDLFYADEDRMDEAGQRSTPFFKPDWSPDLLLSANYIGRWVVGKRHLLDRTGGLNAAHQGEGIYDFLLRVTECTGKIKRIPKVLCHRPLREERCESGIEALREHLDRTHPGAQVEQFLPCRYRVIYPVDTGRKITIVMPSGGNLHFLEPVLEDVFGKTSYPNFDVLVIDNSRSADVQNLVRHWQRIGGAIRYLDRRGQPFNFSRLNNDAVAQVDSPLILFLNDDMTIINAGWLTAMAEHAQRQEIGAVGALLLYPDGRIQHAGVAMGLSGNADHLFKKLPPEPGLCFDLPLVVRNCTAVTAGCLLTRREVFWQAGGFDDQNLAVAFQDVDLCLKIHQCGYRIVYTPFARLYHHESVTKAEKVPNPKEVQFMQEKWRAYIEDDPYYNPNLTRRGEPYGIRLD